MAGVEDNHVGGFVLIGGATDQIEPEGLFLCSIFVFDFPFLNQEWCHKELHCAIIIL